MTRVAALLAIALSLGAHGQSVPEGCQCLWEGSFVDVAPAADLVLYGEVVSRKGNAVDVRPIERWQGDFWRDTARVWMQTGDYCRPAAEQFPEGSQWIMALAKITEVPDDGFNPHTPNQSYGRPDDYVLSACGGYWMAVRGETSVGNLLPNMTRWDHAPDMQPVLVELVGAFVRGQATVDDLRAASEEDPALKALMLDTRSFLRGQEGLINDEVEDVEENPPR